MSGNNERRTEKRVWLKMPLTISQQTGDSKTPTALVETINVSRHGACLITDGEIGIGDSLTLFLSDETKDSIVGHVTWQDFVGIRQRVGVRFDCEPTNWIIA